MGGIDCLIYLQNCQTIPFGSSMHYFNFRKLKQCHFFVGFSVVTQHFCPRVQSKVEQFLKLWLVSTFSSLSPALGGIEASQTDRQRGGEIWWTPLDTWQPIFVLCWKTSCVGQKIQEGNTQTRLSTIPWHELISVQRSESQSEPNWNTFAKLFWCQLRDICPTVKQFHWGEFVVCVCAWVCYKYKDDTCSSHRHGPVNVVTNCGATRVSITLRHIALQVRDTSVIGCIASANTADTVCRPQTDASLPSDSSAGVQSLPTHPLFFFFFSWSPGTHLHTCTHPLAHCRSRIRAKYRWWGRAIGSCQMRPHYQPLTVRLLCSSIMTSRCTCLSTQASSTHGHSGQTKYSRAPSLSLSVASRCCTTLQNTPRSPQNTLIFNLALEQAQRGGQAGLKSYTVPPTPISSPFIETRWHYNGYRDLLTPERGPLSTIHADYSGDVCLYESIFGKLANKSGVTRVEGDSKAVFFQVLA